MKNCLIITNQNFYDLVNINGLLNYIKDKYDIINLVVRKNIYEHSYFILRLIGNINLIIVDDDINLNEINIDFHDMDKILLGDYNKNIINNFNINNPLINYFAIFYDQLNLDYNIKFEYEHIERDFKSEDYYYKKLLSKLKNGYIFYYNKFDNFILDDSKKFIFNPLYNYYENDEYKKKNWINLQYNYIFDLSKIIENAYEIHIFDIDIFSIMPYLNLNNVKSKYIYNNNIRIKEYHKNLNDFIFIYHEN